MYRLLLKIGVVSYFGLFLLATAGLGGYWVVYQQTPEQPIAFAHAVHAGELQLPCNFCHRYVEQGREAGIPSLSLCMSCHLSIATDRAEIKKLTRYVEAGQPVYWSRLHRLPDFIYFSHKRHSKGGIPCAACHGEVARMESVRRVRSLEMGWCLACHRERGAPIDCTVCHK
jgi:hypothetical protein